MTVFVLDCAKPGLRGELTRWLMEVKAGVFVGKMSARVRDKLWAKICGQHADGALLIYRAGNEQGFVVRSHRDPSRLIIDIEGLQLVQLR